jgi:histidine ammonia-lyase
MGANAATQAYTLVNNVERILAIELFNGSQALQFRAPLKSSEFIESFLSIFRKEVSFVNKDRVLHDDIDSSIEFIKTLQIDSCELYQ